LDLSSIQLDGIHTPSKREYRWWAEKKYKTSNMLILTDSQGILLVCSEPEEGNHNGAYNLVNKVDMMLQEMRHSTIATERLFLNADLL